MKILVCISKTPDTTAKIAFTDNNTKFDTNGVQWIINPYDEWYALVRAIELKEADASNSIHLISVGGSDAEPILRKALALGAIQRIGRARPPRKSVLRDVGVGSNGQGWPILPLLPRRRKGG